jgi:hypothetical protein
MIGGVTLPGGVAPEGAGEVPGGVTPGGAGVVVAPGATTPGGEVGVVAPGVGGAPAVGMVAGAGVTPPPGGVMIGGVTDPAGGAPGLGGTVVPGAPGVPRVGLMIGGVMPPGVAPPAAGAAAAPSSPPGLTIGGVRAPGGIAPAPPFGGVNGGAPVPPPLGAVTFRTPLLAAGAVKLSFSPLGVRKVPAARFESSGATGMSSICGSSGLTLMPESCCESPVYCCRNSAGVRPEKRLRPNCVAGAQGETAAAVSSRGQ